MPVTKQAIKKVRQDKRKAIFNLKQKKAYKKAVSDFRKNPSLALLTKAFSALDRAAKINVIHKKTASRLKSRLSKHIKASGTSTKKEAPVKKKVSKKSSK